jgi:hypothetical protein
MTDFDKYSGRIALLVPTFHILTCGIFITGYSIGFGANIIGLFSVSDFFTITMQYLRELYLSSLLLFSISILFLFYKPNIKNISDENSAIQKNKKPPVNLPKFMYIIVILLAVIVFILAAREIYLGLFQNKYVKFYGIFQQIFLQYFAIYTMYVVNSVNNLKNPKIFKMGLVFTIFSILLHSFGAVGIGLEVGQRDRKMPFEWLKNDRMTCGSNVVLNPIGERFISVTSDNRRHIIDDKCQTVFDFPSVAPFQFDKDKPVATHATNSSQTKAAQEAEKAKANVQENKQ